MTPDTPPTTTLSTLAATRAGASRVFQRHGIDFCCGGRRPLEEACREKGLDPDAVLAEIQAEDQGAAPEEAWTTLAPEVLVDRIEATYHASHRAELPELLAMARKVEEVHREREDRPRGLAAHLAAMASDIELHMQKEEQILFPMIRRGQGAMCGGPIQVMEMEHEDAAAALRRTRALTSDLTPPEDACTTWKALYTRLAAFERELMEHAGLENDVLFPQVLGAAH